MEDHNHDRIWSENWVPPREPASKPLKNPAPPRRKRAPVACRRCRRLRSKCVHENAKPPCDLCRAAGDSTAEDCVFVSRSKGDQDRANDREYRQKRNSLSQTGSNGKSSPIAGPSGSSQRVTPDLVEVVFNSPTIISLSPKACSDNISDPWSIFPPFEEVFEGCKTFFTACFQLGFLPKAIFLERLATDRGSLSVFMLLSILSVSARFTKCLTERYGNVTKATDYFINRAGDLIHNEIYKPSIERTQAFFLLGVSEWTQENRTRSSMHMGIAIRMAGIQHLHREESYILPQNATTTEIINSEVARRTFWILESQDHLYSEHNAVVSFPLAGITTLLPSDETDFAYGAIPHERAALGGTRVALESPNLCSLQNRSPFATLIQAHNHWGKIARQAGRASRTIREKAEHKIKPWENGSEYSQMTKELAEWEAMVPGRHQWSLINLRGHKAEFLDLAWLSQVMVVRISNIVIRRIYLEDILESKFGTSSSNCPVPEFWTQMSYELFANVCSLHEQFDTWFSLRSADEGIPSIVVFSVYICGSIASYLWKGPQLCPELADRAELILNRSLEVMNALIDRLPHVSRWLHALQKITSQLRQKGSVDSHAPGVKLGQHNTTSVININAESCSNQDVVPKEFETNLQGDFASLGQDEGGQFQFQPAVDGDDYMPWGGGVSSLDFNSSYSFDEELLRLVSSNI